VLSPLGRNYYLNITPNNVVRIYSNMDSLPTGSPTSVRVRDLSPDDLNTNILPMTITPRPSPDPSNPGSRHLFNPQTPGLRPCASVLRTAVTPVNRQCVPSSGLRPAVSASNQTRCIIAPVISPLTPRTLTPRQMVATSGLTNTSTPACRPTVASSYIANNTPNILSTSPVIRSNLLLQSSPVIQTTGSPVIFSPATAMSPPTSTRFQFKRTTSTNSVVSSPQTVVQSSVDRSRHSILHINSVVPATAPVGGSLPAAAPPVGCVPAAAPPGGSTAEVDLWQTG